MTVETINKNKYKKEEVQNMDGFMMFKKALQKHFDAMQKLYLLSKIKFHTLFTPKF